MLLHECVPLALFHSPSTHSMSIDVHEALLNPDNVGIRRFSDLKIFLVLEVSKCHSRHEPFKSLTLSKNLRPPKITFHQLRQASSSIQLNEYVELSGSSSYTHKEPVNGLSAHLASCHHLDHFRAPDTKKKYDCLLNYFA